MKTHLPAKTRLSAVLALCTLCTVTLTSCVGKPASEYELDAAADCPFTPSDVSGSVRLGYQVIPGPDTYLRDQGTLEACLPNVDVTWTRFPTGQDVVQGFASGSIDYGFLGSTPAAKALSAPLNLDVIIPLVSLFNDSSEALVAKHATTVKELKGSKIATAFSSTAHYSLLKALESAGLDPRRDVEITNISPDKLPAAWASDEIEAAYIWNPTLMEIQRSGTTLLDSGDVGRAGSPTFNVPMMSRAHTEANPEILTMWVKLQNWATQQAVDDPQGYIAANAAQTQMTPEETEKQLQGIRHVPADQQPAAIAEVAQALYDTATFLEEQGEVQAADLSHYQQAARPVQAARPSVAARQAADAQPAVGARQGTEKGE